MGVCSQIQMKAEKIVNSPIVKEPFRVITITLLSLLLPLSFLILARLSSSRFFLTLATNNNNININYITNNTHFFSFFLYTNPAILYFIVSIISISTLIHNLILTNNNYDINRSSSNNKGKIRLYASWIVLCTLQICVGLGIEGSVEFGIDFSTFLGSKNVGNSNYNNNRVTSLLSKVVFFLGLHETMLHWSGLVVTPVVDDTVFSGLVGPAESWSRRGALAGGFASLWYWRLREEVESMVAVAEMKGEMLMEVGLGDFIAWWLYYLTVTVGLVRVVKALMWLPISFFRGRLYNINYNNNNNNINIINHDHDDHVDHDLEKVMMNISRNNVDVC